MAVDYILLSDRWQIWRPRCIFLLFRTYIRVATAFSRGILSDRWIEYAGTFERQTLGEFASSLRKKYHGSISAATAEQSLRVHRKVIFAEGKKRSLRAWDDHASRRYLARYLCLHTSPFRAASSLKWQYNTYWKDPTNLPLNLIYSLRASSRKLEIRESRFSNIKIAPRNGAFSFSFSSTRKTPWFSTHDSLTRSASALLRYRNSPCFPSLSRQDKRR